MRTALAAALCLLVSATASAGAGSDGEPAVPAPATSGIQLVKADTAAWRYQLVTAPALATQIGALATSGLDVAAGRAQEPLEVLGEPTIAPAAWPYGLDTASRATGALEPVAPADRRIAAMFALTTFELTADQAGLRVLEIRLRYRDGCAVWLNGIEIARRSLTANASTVELAARPHGPEWETFYVLTAPQLLRLGENVLAVEVHPSARRDNVELAADVIGRRDLGIVRGPILADVGATTATITVQTDPTVDATLEWGVGSALDHQVGSTPGRRHTFTLSGLPPRGRISYRVRAGAAQTETFAFQTAPAAGEVVRIGIYGDVRGGHDVHRRIVEHLLAEGVDLVGVTGDLVLRGPDEGDWQRFFAVTRELLAQIRYVTTMGNHDVGWGLAHADPFALAPAPAGRPPGAYWSSMDFADIHLVFLDSNEYDRAEQEQWLDADLAAARARNVRAILALVHDGPYSRGTHRGNELAVERYVPILARHHVDLVLSGHDHIYQRGEAGGIRYIVSGGGGAPLYKPSCGVRGKQKCPDDGMQKLLSENHYLVLTFGKDTFEMCPRKPDGTLLEKCVRYPLWHP